MCRVRIIPILWGCKDYFKIDIESTGQPQSLLGQPATLSKGLLLEVEARHPCGSRCSEEVD